MKIVFAGTPNFAKQHLEMVLDSKHEIIGVLTQPDRRSGRGKKLQSSACLLYTSPSPRDISGSRMPSSA